MEIVRLVLLLLAIFSLLASVFLVVLTTIVFWNRRSAEASNVEFPPISILKPLAGLDPGLEDNLEAFFVQDYPEFELIFACNEESDPALRIARRLRARHPNTKVKYAVGSTHHGYNPKVNNLIRAYSQASYGLILTSDSDTQPPIQHLRAICQEFQEGNCQLLVNPIRGVGEDTFGAKLETLHLNGLILSGIALLSLYRGRVPGFGKSMLFDRRALDACGGFMGVKDYLAEDYVLSQRIARLPGRCAVSKTILPCITSQRSLKQFVSRHARWAKIRFHIAGLLYPSEILANPIFWAFWFALASSFNSSGVIVFLMILFIKTGLELFQNQRLHRSGRLFIYLFVPLKDLLVGFLWFYPFLTDAVYWRGVRLKLTKETLLREA